MTAVSTDSGAVRTSEPTVAAAVPAAVPSSSTAAAGPVDPPKSDESKTGPDSSKCSSKKVVVLKSLYRRELPSPPATAFASDEGKALFQSALSAGHMEGFFLLMEQFQTQADPSFCGLGTLAMVLNALAIDPGRIWKGSWRWFDETMLDCCEPLEVVRAKGITFRKLACLGRCNGAIIEEYRGGALDLFRKHVKEATSNPEKHIIVSYSRIELGQSGDGHFSPIGGYDPVSDKVLILDVARFKYPPHWVDLELIHKAMLRVDAVTKQCRGWMTVTRPAIEEEELKEVTEVVSVGSPSKMSDAASKRPLYFVLVNHPSNWNDFFKFLSNDLPKFKSVGKFAEVVTEKFIEAVSTYLSHYTINYVPPEYKSKVAELLDQLHLVPLNVTVNTILKEYVKKNSSDGTEFIVAGTESVAADFTTMLIFSIPFDYWEGLDVKSEILPLVDCTKISGDLLRKEIKALRHQMKHLMKIAKETFGCEDGCGSPKSEE